MADGGNSPLPSPASAKHKQHMMDHMVDERETAQYATLNIEAEDEFVNGKGKLGATQRAIASSSSANRARQEVSDYSLANTTITELNYEDRENSPTRAAAKRPLRRVPVLRGLTREAAAEFFGTFILILFGDGVVAQVVLGNSLLRSCAPDSSCDPTPAGNNLSINIAWGLAVLFGVIVSAKPSGAHLNPAVTLTLAIWKGFPWRKVLPYVLAQTAGAFVAAAVIYSVYLDAFNQLDPNRTMATAGVFATYPKAWMSVLGGFWDQVVGTALLLAGIFAIGDSRNVGLSPQMGPFAVALLVVVIGAAFGVNTGYAINPARDLGPRLFTLVAGWGTQVFTAGNYWAWIPVVAPCIGGPIGGFLYMLFVEQHHPAAQL